MRWAVGIAVRVSLAGTLGSCHGQEVARVADMTCPSDGTNCVGAAPSYANDVAPIVSSNCNGCHSAGGTASDWPLATYDDVFKVKAAAFTAVYGCVMPPADDPVDQLTYAQRTTLIQWLACGAPKN